MLALRTYLSLFSLSQLTNFLYETFLREINKITFEFQVEMGSYHIASGQKKISWTEYSVYLQCLHYFITITHVVLVMSRAVDVQSIALCSASLIVPQSMRLHAPPPFERTREVSCISGFVKPHFNVNSYNFLYALSHRDFEQV